MKEQNKNLFEKNEKSIELRQSVIQEWFPGKLPERKEVLIKKELSKEEKKEKERFKKKIDKSKFPSQKEADVLKESEKIKRQSVQKQIDYLLFLAQQKGISFAIRTAKATNDAFLIDIFHDVLAKEGLYKKFQM